jgi:hypothetical protein
VLFVKRGILTEGFYTYFCHHFEPPLLDWLGYVRQLLGRARHVGSLLRVGGPLRRPLPEVSQVHGPTIGGEDRLVWKKLALKRNKQTEHKGFFLHTKIAANVFVRY